MFAIAGIDGTGAYNDAEYNRHFNNSYVKRFCTDISSPSLGHYQRGPTMEGATTRGRANDAALQLTQAHASMSRSGSRPGIFLAGYSRGGAAAIRAAKLLAETKIPVDALFLFDAVDRAVGVDVEKIPANVVNVYHAMRSSSAESRQFFGNCGVRYHKESTSYHAKWFHCTHGAMGGTPWQIAGSDGQIYEGDSTISIGMAILLPMPLQPVARSLYKRSNTTRVTLEQEKSGSAKVLSWMTDNFAREKHKAELCHKFRNVAPDHSHTA